MFGYGIEVPWPSSRRKPLRDVLPSSWPHRRTALRYRSCCRSIAAIAPGHPMSIGQRLNMLLLCVMVLGITFSSASSRPWKATPIQIAADYAQINDAKGSTEFVNIRWWAPPTVVSGTPLAGILEKYIVVSVNHFHVNQPGATISFDDIVTLEALDGGNKPLAIVPRNELPPAAIGVLSTLEAAFRQSLGRLGEGTKFFTFDAGAVRACEKGGISVPFAGETYTWETPFPGCSGVLVTPLAPAYGRLGVRFQLVTEDIAASKKLKSARGVLVTDIDDSGAAKPAGIQVGDVIIRMDGKDIADIRDLPRIVAGTPADKTVDVAVIRDGEEIMFSVTLGH